MDVKIVIVDDDKKDLEILVHILSKAGYGQVQTAPSGEEGLALIKQEAFDLVILDTVLPGMNGFEVCEMIRKETRLDQMKVIIQTGHADAVDASRSRQVGADDTVAKTANAAPLLEVIKKIM